MPPEPLPWDRKDLSKERRYEKMDAIGSATRWRDSYRGSREFYRSGSADSRRPTGRGKQGGWHQFSEESSHGYGPSRSCSDRVLVDESFRPSVSRGDGKYIRIGRGSRGSFTHRDWRSYSREANNGFGNPSRRPSLQDLSSDQKSVDDRATYSSPQSDFASGSDRIHSKDLNDKVGGVCGLENGTRSDLEVSLGSTDWKPLKWSRSGSLSSWGSYSSSMNSKTEKADLPHRVASPIERPSAEATASVTSSLPLEDIISRKKPRLGWGDGLAKYEKVKPDTSLRKEGTLLSSSSYELTHSLGSNFAEKSPKTLPFSECASPATPSSFACSSSPGLEDRPFSKVASVDGMLCSSPGSGSQNQLQKFLFSLEKVEISSIANLGSSLDELFHSDDLNTVESCFGKSTLNKLLAYKSEISKTLEMTESEIDLLENELKCLKSENGGNVSHPKSCSALHLVKSATNFKEPDGVSCIAPRPAALKIVSSSDATVEKMPVCEGDMGVEGVETKNEEIDSPGTVTSKFNEPSRVVKGLPSTLLENDQCSEVTDAIVVPDKMKGKFPISGHFVDEHRTIGSGNECIPIKSCSGESIYGDLMEQDDSGSSLCDLIFACNKEYANKAAEVIFKELPTEVCKISTQSTNNISCSETEKVIKEKFAMRRQFLKFKESALTLRFKALQHSWKEGLLHSVKKFRPRPQKKELSLRVTHSGHQKYRSSIRSRLIQHGACSNPALNSEIAIRYSGKLLLNPHVRLYRNTLKMPAMILDKKEKMASRFVSHNGLVENPCAVEKERSMINPWTSEERGIFWEKLSLFGKDFRKISSFLDHKTTADCVQFYYKNHKSNSFKKSKNLELGKQIKSSTTTTTTTTYLVTSGKKWNPDVNATSLDLLGVASVMAAQEDSNFENPEKCTHRMGMRGMVEPKVSWSADCTPLNKNNIDDLQTEKETVAADVLAGICGSISSEAMSSCITSAIDPGGDYMEWKYQKVDSATKLPPTPDVMQIIDNEPCSDDSSEDVDSSNWTDEEKSIFMQAVSSYGRDFDMISRCVRSKSRDQCKVFFSKARNCLGLDLMHMSVDVGGPGSGNDASESGTDTEDNCFVEGARSSDELGSKLGDGLSTSININREESVSTVTANMHSSSEFEESTALQQSDAKGADAVGNLISDSSQEEDGPNRDSHSACNLTNTGASPSQPLHDHQIEGSENTEAGSICCNEPNILRFESVSAVDENSAFMSERRAILSPAFGEEGRSNLHGQSILQCSVHDSSVIDSNLALEGRSLGLDPQTSHPNILEVDFVEKSFIKSEEKSPALVHSDPGVMEKEQNPDILPSTLVLQEVRDMNKKSTKRENYTEHQNHLSCHVESSEFPCSYPFNKPIIEDINRNINHTYFPVQRLSKPDINCNNVAEECYLQNCYSSKPSHSHQADKLPFLPLNVEFGHGHQKNSARSGSASDSDVPHKKGAVKLFGQILSHAPSQQHSSSGSNDCGEKKGIHKSSSKSYDMGENVLLRSYGFWDGNRIQTGLSALPDSAILQAKYPAAFSGYSAMSVKTKLQPLQALANNGDPNLNGVVPAFPTKDGMVDYQSYRSRDSVNMRPFPVDKFSEMHRRNGFDAVSFASLQQQGRVLVGMNVVGRGGILMGGSCMGVSDPIPYAKAEQHVGQPGSAFPREDDGRWRGGNRDLGSSR